MQKLKRVLVNCQQPDETLQLLNKTRKTQIKFTEQQLILHY